MARSTMPLYAHEWVRLLFQVWRQCSTRADGTCALVPPQLATQASPTGWGSSAASTAYGSAGASGEAYSAGSVGAAPDSADFRPHSRPGKLGTRARRRRKAEQAAAAAAMAADAPPPDIAGDAMRANLAILDRVCREHGLPPPSPRERDGLNWARPCPWFRDGEVAVATLISEQGLQEADHAVMEALYDFGD